MTKRQLERAIRAIDEAIEYFDNRADVLDGEDGFPRPDRAMQLLRDLTEAAVPLRDAFNEWGMSQEHD